MEVKHKMAEKSTVLLATLLVIVALFVGGLSAYALFPQEKSTITLVDKPVLVETPYNDTALVGQVAAIQASLDEDDLFEVEAIKLAEAEWNDEDELFDALLALNVTDLDDEDDIYKVVIKDTDTSGLDADDKDADVSQEVRVYYENSVGENIRVTLDIETEIVDGEVEDVIYALA